MHIPKKPALLQLRGGGVGAGREVGGGAEVGTGAGIEVRGRGWIPGTET